MESVMFHFTWHQILKTKFKKCFICFKALIFYNFDIKNNKFTQITLSLTFWELGGNDYTISLMYVGFMYVSSDNDNTITWIVYIQLGDPWILPNINGVSIVDKETSNRPNY